MSIPSCSCCPELWIRRVGRLIVAGGVARGGDIDHLWDTGLPLPLWEPHQYKGQVGFSSSEALPTETLSGFLKLLLSGLWFSLKHPNGAHLTSPDHTGLRPTPPVLNSDVTAHRRGLTGPSKSSFEAFPLPGIRSPGPCGSFLHQQKS